MDGEWCAVPGPLSTAIGRLRDWRGCDGVMVQGCRISCTSPAAGVPSSTYRTVSIWYSACVGPRPHPASQPNSDERGRERETETDRWGALILSWTLRCNAGVCSVQSCQHGHITEAGTSAPCLFFQGPPPITRTPPLSPQADARFSNTYPRVTSLWIAAIIATTSIPTVRLRLSSAFDVQGCPIDTTTTTDMVPHSGRRRAPSGGTIVSASRYR